VIRHHDKCQRLYVAGFMFNFQAPDHGTTAGQSLEDRTPLVCRCTDMVGLIGNISTAFA